MDNKTFDFNSNEENLCLLGGVRLSPKGTRHVKPHRDHAEAHKRQTCALLNVKEIEFTE